MTSAAEHNLEGREGDRNQNDPQVVHPGAPALGAQIKWVVYVCVHHYCRERTDRNVDVEIPAPTEALSYPSTKCRADDGRGHHSDAEGRHRERMFLDGKRLEHNRLRKWHHRGAGEALHHAEHDYLSDAPREPAECGGRHEHPD